MVHITLLKVFIKNHGYQSLVRLIFLMLRRPSFLYQFIKAIATGNLVETRHAVISALSIQQKVSKSDLRDNLEAENYLKSRDLNNHSYSVVIPVYRPSLDELEKCVQSVRNQSLESWEIVMVADGVDAANRIFESSYIRESINEIESTSIEHRSFQPKKIRLLMLSENLGINRATQSGIKVARGDRIVFLDQDDLLHRSAIQCLDTVSMDYQAIYSDHAIIDNQENVIDVFKKPDWSPMLAHQIMYFGHIKCFTTSLIREHYSAFPQEGVADHLAMLSIGLSGYKVFHIPVILGFWRTSQNSLASSYWNKPYVQANFEDGIAQINAYRDISFVSTQEFRSHRLIPIYEEKDMSKDLQVIVPTMWQNGFATRLLKKLLSELPEGASVTLIDTLPSKRPNEIKSLKQVFGDQLVILENIEPFNYSKVNNWAAQFSDAEHLLFLNDDMFPLTRNWMTKLQVLLEAGQHGAVGAKLLYENGKVQHGGVALGLRGTADHLYRNWDAKSMDCFESLHLIREVSAVTAACLMTKRRFFEDVGGFDEEFETAYQDLDLCLRLQKMGQIVQAQNVALVHHESASRGSYYSFRDRSRIISRWNTLEIAQDKFEIRNLYHGSSDVR